MKKIFSIGLTAIALAAFVFNGCKKDTPDINHPEYIAGEWSGNATHGSGRMYVKIDNDGNFTYQLNNGEILTGKCDFIGQPTAGTATAKYSSGKEEIWYITIDENKASMSFICNDVMFSLTPGGQPNSSTNGGNFNGGGNSSTKSTICKSCEGSGKCKKIMMGVGCNGTGKCSQCDGKGYYPTARYDCNMCKDGKCDECHGTGKCESCNGTGSTDNPYCNTCIGTGKCFSCDGNGYRKCTLCNGTGRFANKQCSSCKGEGRTKCTLCKGSGYCFNCNGTGKKK